MENLEYLLDSEKTVENIKSIYDNGGKVAIELSTDTLLEQAVCDDDVYWDICNNGVELVEGAELLKIRRSYDSGKEYVYPYLRFDGCTLVVDRVYDTKLGFMGLVYPFRGKHANCGVEIYIGGSDGIDWSFDIAKVLG